MCNLFSQASYLKIHSPSIDIPILTVVFIIYTLTFVYSTPCVFFKKIEEERNRRTKRIF